MADTKLDIYNSALINIGHSKKVNDLDEKTTERRNCQSVYDPYRKALITMAKWSFSTVVQPLTLTGNTPKGYLYEYIYPIKCLKALEIARASSGQDKIPFKSGSIINTDESHQRVIWTDEPDASLVYMRDVEDTKIFTPLFELTLSHYMGVPLSRLMAKSKSMPGNMFDLARFYFNEAVTSGEVEAVDFELPEPEWITGR